MDGIPELTTAKIRELNDALRKRFIGGQMMVTSGIQGLDRFDQMRVIQAVSEFEGFNADNDPYQEHDCATLTVGNYKVMFKIDYYDLELEMCSEDPSNPEVTKRVMTIMLADEY